MLRQSMLRSNLVTFVGNMPLLEIDTSGLFGEGIDASIGGAQVSARSLLGRVAAVEVEEGIASTTVELRKSLRFKLS